jgi:uncharacterized protein (TIGR01244 family)
VFAGPETPAIPNFHQVDEHLFRGAQPAANEFQDLARMGIKTVLDLREEGHSVSERKLVEAAGMRYVSLPMSGLTAPSDQQISGALAVLEDSANGPVFVHCRRGADRTGTVIACYRIAHDGWQNRQALEEARTFGMSRLERAMRRYVLHYRAAAAPIP